LIELIGMDYTVAKPDMTERNMSGPMPQQCHALVCGKAVSETQHKLIIGGTNDEVRLY
jgi:hypothetical protein